MPNCNPLHVSTCRWLVYMSLPCARGEWRRRQSQSHKSMKYMCLCYAERLATVARKVASQGRRERLFSEGELGETHDRSGMTTPRPAAHGRCLTSTPSARKSIAGYPFNIQTSCAPATVSQAE